MLLQRFIHLRITDMTSLCRNLAVLLLFLNASPLLRSHLLAHAGPTSPPVTHPQILFVTALGSDDYDEDYPDNKSPPIVSSSLKPPLVFQEPQPCQYNPCLENQEPCAQLSARTACLCPGLSGADEPPHAPHLKEMVPVSEGDDRGKVEVQWCAPSSVVSGYRVIVEGNGGIVLEFEKASRRGVVGSLEVGTKVCVEAVNHAGHSAASEFSCKRYDPPESSNHGLQAGVIGGGLAFLLLLSIVAVILWKNQMCHKAKRDSAEGLGNPSYSTEGTL
ncbi:hypothetical protein LDENG_00054680 [Lucifuga dentata]|nr:hypothetical protein LDENG_00054680 [Lucifuga dentata]